MSRVLALDLSSTATGVCVDPHLTLLDDEPQQTMTLKPKGSLHHRARAMTATIEEQVDREPPVLVVIEAIGTRHVQTAIAIATVHALVLDRLQHHRILTVTPAQLKKWATGKGNCDKTAMITSAMRAGWTAPDAATDDQADAWWLWTIGHAVLGNWVVPQTAYRTVVLDDLDADNHRAGSDG